MSLAEDSILVRECRGVDEIDACVKLQIDVWEFSALDAVPRRTFLVAQRIGGQVAGAFDLSQPGAGSAGSPSSLVGFAMALPGFDSGRPYLHSHMLAVAERYRNRGIGRRLKSWQRTDALARGIGAMEWTFDPLEMKNSYLNLHRLGAIARRYLPDAYGASSSTLQGTMRTDRLCAEWWLASARVDRALEGNRLPDVPIETTITIPGEIAEWRRFAADRQKAVEVQEKLRIQLEKAFSDGLAIIEFRLDDDGNGVFELGRWKGPAASRARNRISMPRE